MNTPKPEGIQSHLPPHNDEPLVLPDYDFKKPKPVGPTLATILLCITLIGCFAHAVSGFGRTANKTFAPTHWCIQSTESYGPRK